jgi:hypothetical protein
MRLRPVAREERGLRVPTRREKSPIRFLGDGHRRDKRCRDAGRHTHRSALARTKYPTTLVRVLTVQAT